MYRLTVEEIDRYEGDIKKQILEDIEIYGEEFPRDYFSGSHLHNRDNEVIIAAIRYGCFPRCAYGRKTPYFMRFLVKKRMSGVFKRYYTNGIQPTRRYFNHRTMRTDIMNLVMFPTLFSIIYFVVVYFTHCAQKFTNTCRKYSYFALKIIFIEFIIIAALFIILQTLFAVDKRFSIFGARIFVVPRRLRATEPHHDNAALILPSLSWQELVATTEHIPHLVTSPDPSLQPSEEPPQPSEEPPQPSEEPPQLSEEPLQPGEGPD